MATFSPVDTRLRVFPQAVPSGWAAGLQSAAGSVLNAVMQRRAERIMAERDRAARAHEERILGLRHDLDMERLRADFQHQIELTNRRFGHEIDLFDRRALHERLMQEAAQEFQARESEANRILARRGQDIEIRGQDLRHDLGMRQLGVEAVRTGAYAQDVASQIEARQAQAQAQAQGSSGLDPIDVGRLIFGTMGLTYDDEEAFSAELAAIRRAQAVLEGREPAIRITRRSEGGDQGGSRGTPQGAGRLEARGDLVPSGKGGIEIDFSEIDFSTITPQELAEEVRMVAQNRDEARAILLAIPDNRKAQQAMRILGLDQ